MEPLFHHHQTYVLVKKTDQRLKLYDIALFQRPDGTNVLHRVMRVDKDSYLISGDNCNYTEVVPDDWILGVLMGYFPDKDAPFVDCAVDEGYRRYVKTLKLRKRGKRMKTLPKRAIRKLKRVITGENA